MSGQRKKTLRDRMFQSLWRLQRSMTLGVRGVAVNDAGQVLLVRHTYVSGWHFPGGGVERGETCLSALNRELHEEAGLTPAAQPVLVSVHANHAFFPNDHVLVYRIPAWRQEPVNNAHEIAEMGFFHPLSPPEGTTGGTLRRLRELFGGAPADPAW